MVICIKCGYLNCKLGGEVEKENAIKVGTRYYHEECDNKKNVKKSCTDKLTSLNMISKLTGIFLKKTIDDEQVDLEYLEFTIDYIMYRKLKLSSPYGVKYYMGDYKIRAEYDKYIAKKVSSEMKSDMVWDAEQVTSFKPQQKQIPSYLKILK